MKRQHLFPIFILLLATLGGCAGRGALSPSPDQPAAASVIVEVQDIEIPTPFSASAPGLSTAYRIGPGDELGIQVIDLPAGAGDGAWQDCQVFGSGKVVLPDIGAVPVSGLSLDEAQQKVQALYAQAGQNSLVAMKVLKFKSRPLFLIGKFTRPGVRYLDRPMHLVDGLSLGEGFAAEADLRGARLIRGKRVMPVDIFELISNGDQRQNIPLAAGDTIYVPGRDQASVFVFGAVSRSGAIPMPAGALTLAQALHAAGLEQGAGKPATARLVRSLTPTRGKLLVVDLAAAMSAGALPLPLTNGDIVYVEPIEGGDWTRAIADLRPSLQMVGTWLQPFVQIKYLTEGIN